MLSGSLMSWNVSYRGSVTPPDYGATVPIPLLPSFKGVGLGGRRQQLGSSQRPRVNSLAQALISFKMPPNL